MELLKERNQSDPCQNNAPREGRSPPEEMESFPIPVILSEAQAKSKDPRLSAFSALFYVNGADSSLRSE